MVILTFVSMATYAQSIVVTGKVIDSEGYEVIGGSVTLKGAAGVGTVTNVDGNYSLKVNNASKDVLVFSYVGMTTKEVKINGQSVINVTLEADAVMLDEVVTIGYATVKKKDLTGSAFSPMAAKPKPKNTAKKIIGNNSPLVKASKKFVGTMFTIVSIK